VFIPNFIKLNAVIMLTQKQGKSDNAENNTVNNVDSNTNGSAKNMQETDNYKKMNSYRLYISSLTILIYVMFLEICTWDKHSQ